MYRIPDASVRVMAANLSLQNLWLLVLLAIGYAALVRTSSVRRVFAVVMTVGLVAFVFRGFVGF